jgi:hypothetical protein
LKAIVEERLLTGTLPPNAWSHVAFAKNGSNYAFYINGVQNETGTWQPDAVTLTKPGFRFVGGNNNPPYEYFTGVRE